MAHTVRPHPSSQGFTILESLVALAVLGVLLGIGFVSLRTPAVRVYANDVRALVQEARYEAIKQNRPVAVVWRSGVASFETVVNASSREKDEACSGATVLERADSRELRDVVVTVDADFGLVWLPSGRGATCDGSVLSETDIGIGDGARELTIHVTAVGGVDIE